MKKTKLVLKKETIALLGDSNLRAVVAGAVATRAVSACPCATVHQPSCENCSYGCNGF